MSVSSIKGCGVPFYPTLQDSARNFLSNYVSIRFHYGYRSQVVLCDQTYCQVHHCMVATVARDPYNVTEQCVAPKWKPHRAKVIVPHTPLACAYLWFRGFAKLKKTWIELTHTSTFFFRSPSPTNFGTIFQLSFRVRLAPTHFHSYLIFLRIFKLCKPPYGSLGEVSVLDSVWLIFDGEVQHNGKMGVLTFRFSRSRLLSCC